MTDLLQFFAYAHLPPQLQQVSEPFAELAERLVETLPANPARDMALRKLLEANNCSVRALLWKGDSAGEPEEDPSLTDLQTVSAEVSHMVAESLKSGREEYQPLLTEEDLRRMINISYEELAKDVREAEVRVSRAVELEQRDWLLRRLRVLNTKLEMEGRYVGADTAARAEDALRAAYARIDELSLSAEERDAFWSVGVDPDQEPTRQPDGELAGLRAVVRSIRRDAAFVSIVSFFVTPHPDLEGDNGEAMTPFAWLSSGHNPDVVARLAAEI